MFFSTISAIFLVCLQQTVLNSSVSHRLALNSFRARQMDFNSATDGGGCKSYMLVGARGTSEVQGTGSMAYNSLEEKVLSSVPNGGKYEIVYSSSAEYTVSPRQGAASGLQYVKETISKCPNTVFVLIGYSKGAMVITQMLADEGLPRNKVAAVALFGNPYFTTGAPQNKCSATSGQGIASAMMVRAPAEYQDVIFDCCHQGDMMCQTSGSIMAHLTYQNDGEPQAAQFIIGKLKSESTSRSGRVDGYAGETTRPSQGSSSTQSGGMSSPPKSWGSPFTSSGGPFSSMGSSMGNPLTSMGNSMGSPLSSMGSSMGSPFGSWGRKPF